jgi:hypothetical protein
MKGIFSVIGVFWAGLALASAADKVTNFDEDRLQIALPDGWKKSAQPMQGAAGGWESSDRKTSFYVMGQVTNQSADMRDALKGVIDSMDASDQWALQKIGDFRDITLNGLPAVYVKVDLELMSGGRAVPFVFHFAMVGSRASFFLLQSSTMKPIWQVREDEVIRMMKSFKVLKEE